MTKGSAFEIMPDKQSGTYSTEVCSDCGFRVSSGCWCQKRPYDYQRLNGDLRKFIAELESEAVRLDTELAIKDRAIIELEALVHPKIIPYLITECNHCAEMKVCNNCQQRNIIFQQDEDKQKLQATIERVQKEFDRLLVRDTGNLERLIKAQDTIGRVRRLSRYNNVNDSYVMLDNDIGLWVRHSDILQVLKDSGVGDE